MYENVPPPDDININALRMGRRQFLTGIIYMPSDERLMTLAVCDAIREEHVDTTTQEILDRLIRMGVICVNCHRAGAIDLNCPACGHQPGRYY